MRGKGGAIGFVFFCVVFGGGLFYTQYQTCPAMLSMTYVYNQGQKSIDDICDEQFVDNMYKLAIMTVAFPIGFLILTNVGRNDKWKSRYQLDQERRD